MKHSNFKKVLSVVLSLLLISAIMGGGWQIKAEAARGYTPIVYVHGAKSIYVFNEDGSMTAPVDEDNPTSTFVDALGDLAPLLAKAVANDDWDPYCDAVVALFENTYKDVAPNPDGTLPENTGIIDTFPRDYNAIPAESPYYGLSTYVFSDDIRRSPLDIADDLNAFIETVKAKTGHDKVVLVSRCAGTTIASAYLYKYQKDIGYADIEKCVFEQGTSRGIDELEAVLTGKVQIMPEAAFRYLKTGGMFTSTEESEGAELIATLNVILDFLYSTMGLNAACALLQQIYNKISYKMFGRIVKMYHARCLTTVASIVDNYEDYKNYIFCEEGDLETYANIIAKADEYHYNVQPAIDDMILEMQAMGKPVAVIADYGDQLSPVYPESEYVADTRTSLANMSFGATTAKVNGTLSEAYIAGRTEAGFGAYISPDKQVDASTCLLPETTWIVKNLHHGFVWPVDVLITRFAREDGFNIHSDPNYPQFLNYNETTGALTPAQEVNENDIQWAKYEEDARETGVPGFIEKATEWIQKLINKFLDFLYIILGPLGLMTKD